MDDASRCNIDDLLSRFAELRGRRFQISPVTTSAGFSGGSVWRVETPARPLALRIWTNDYPAERVAAIHQLWRRAGAAGCDFVPQAIVADDGQSVHLIAGRVWELATWMPGAGDWHGARSHERLLHAVETLARWHNAFDPSEIQRETAAISEEEFITPHQLGLGAKSFGMMRRAREWERLRRLDDGFADQSFTPFGAIDRIHDLAVRTIRAARRLAPRMEHWLGEVDQFRPLAVCLRDLRAEHVLFSGNLVTGIVDYGAVGLDHVECDLGRLLGDMLADDMHSWSKAIEHYLLKSGKPVSFENARRFDQTGAVIGALHWYEWMAVEHRQFADPAAAIARWESLVLRIESW